MHPMDLVSNRVRKAALRVAGVSALLGAGAWMVVGQAPSAFADASPYELYCPGTPVGTIALNNVTATGSISPSTPAVGSTFNLANYQANVTIPENIVAAAQALGNTAINGSATAQFDVTGATPATKASPTLTFDEPIPSTIPSSGMTLTLPSAPTSIGPFTATSSNISVDIDKSTSLTLMVSGSPLALTCTAYPNNTETTGILPSGTAAPPASSAIAPSLASTTASSTSATSSPPTTAATTATTAAPSPMAYTGAGPGLRLLAVLGASGLALAGLLMLWDRGRHLLVVAARGRAPRSGRDPGNSS